MNLFFLSFGICYLDHAFGAAEDRWKTAKMLLQSWLRVVQLIRK
jgi:hypothetical protein